MTASRRSRVEITIDDERGVFMISVAAELAEMHPQTLRMYEARGLIAPKRSPKNTRLYSQRDVERLRRIQRDDLGGGPEPGRGRDGAGAGRAGGEDERGAGTSAAAGRGARSGLERKAG